MFPTRVGMNRIPTRFKILLRRVPQATLDCSSLHSNNEDIGFIKISSQFTNVNVQVIALCAIKPEHRNPKYGTQMIRMVIEDYPTGTEIFALCTIYSRAMQRVLKNLKFHRDKKTNNLRLESYRLTKES